MLHYQSKHDSLSSHQQILRIIRSLHEQPILDVGSAQGVIGQALAGSGSTIDAIEPNTVWAEAARPYYRQVFNTTVEQAPLTPASYGMIVCADVLEHLPDPAGVLARLRQAAKPQATFIISLPNVAHLSVRVLLLLGRFPRMERGILDKTHLQFFTRKTAIDLLQRAGLTVHEVRATPVPIELITASRAINIAGGAMQRLLIRLMPGAFAFQWIFIASGAR